MFDIFRGRRPDVTPAQVAAVLVAGVPAAATLLAAFGIANLDQSQQDALAGMLMWSAVLAGLLIGGDATLRTARNVADAKRDTAAMLVGSTGGGSPAEPHDPEVDDLDSAIEVDEDEDEDEESYGDALDEEESSGETEHERANERWPVDDPDLIGADK